MLACSALVSRLLKSTDNPISLEYRLHDTCRAELLGLPSQLHKQELDTVYLQELFRIRQKQQV